MTVARTHNDILLYQLKLSRIAVTNSSARGQPTGTTEVAQNFLTRINLRLLSGVEDAVRFSRILDQWTKILRSRLQSKSWGHARKFLNIYLYLCSRDHKLRNRYRLAGLDDLLEIPLDSHVAKALKAFEQCKVHSLKGRLVWTSIGRLTSAQNQEFQRSARALATKLHLSCADLDLILWRQPPLMRTKCILCQENSAF